jgi:hypothetical protein
MRNSAALILLLALVGCQTCPVPKAPEFVTVPIEKYRPLPAWALQPLPEDAPHANTVAEATRLASERLSTIRAENCRKRLLARLDKGEAVSAKECER